MQTSTTNNALAQAGDPYTTQAPGKPAQPETPTRWLCRLGPWQMQFNQNEAGIYMRLADWAQEKTGHWVVWDECTQKATAHIIWTGLHSGTSCVMELFGRTMRLDLLPLPNTKKPIRFKLPTFYEPPAHCSGDWDCVEVHPVSDDGDGMVELLCDGDPNISYWCVYLHQCSGGLECVADLATREQASSLAAILMSGATWFVPAK